MRAPITSTFASVPASPSSIAQSSSTTTAALSPPSSRASNERWLANTARELSTKVFAGKCRLTELGFRPGGALGFGLRRVLIDQFGVRKGDLGKGEAKSIQTDRVVLVAGSKTEVALVREIYRRFVKDLASEKKIADTLNSSRHGQGKRAVHWTRGTIHQVLINENYIGNNVWNRVSFKLRKKRVRNHPDMWIRADGVFPSIVDRQLFDAAQTIIRARIARMSDQAMLRRPCAAAGNRWVAVRGHHRRGRRHPLRPLPIVAALGASPAPINSSAMHHDGTSVTSRSIERCARFILGFCQRSLMAFVGLAVTSTWSREIRSFLSMAKSPSR